MVALPFKLCILVLPMAITSFGMAQLDGPAWPEVFNPVKEMNTGRNSLGVAEIDGHLHAVGGGNDHGGHYNSMEVYNPFSNYWFTSGSSMNEFRSGLGVVALGGKLYAIGGRGGTNESALNILSSMEVYDPATWLWTSAPSMTSARRNMGVGVLDGLIYVAGGQDGNLDSVSIMIVFDPSSNTWGTGASMNTARESFAFGVLGGKLYAIGGLSTSGDFLSSMESYDPASGQWTAGPDVNVPFGRVCIAAGSHQGKLYVVGASTDVAVYDPQTNSWAAGPSMSTLTIAPAVGVLGGNLYVVGGYDYANSVPFQSVAVLFGQAPSLASAVV